MKNWNQLFIRQGWNVKEQSENVFCLQQETNVNIDFLLESLNAVEASYTLQGELLTVSSAPVSEESWLQVVDFKGRGYGEDLWFRPGEDQPKVKELDTYISGIVRQFNRLGFYTSGSCDGHEKRSAHVMLVRDTTNIDHLVGMLLALGMKHVHYRESKKHYHVRLTLSRKELLELAENMSVIEKEWLDKGTEYIKKQLFNLTLVQLLSIPGESGKEDRVREYVKSKITPFVDYITVDRHGNLLAKKTYRTGNGPTILLNAHLDTVESIHPERKIIKNGDIWTSNRGILGADDRAGVAVILHMAEHLYHSTFNGKVKFVFTVKEECGLVGASALDKYFLWGTDAAIVIDRPGNSDIVTSCGGYIPFCNEAYGTFFEEVAEQEGLNNWKCTPGGSSDTCIWASNGIQSVNLSAGYVFKHTEEEFLNVEECYRVTQLLKGVFIRGRELYGVLGEIKRSKFVDRIAAAAK